jgi:hypothetical protein
MGATNVANALDALAKFRVELEDADYDMESKKVVDALDKLREGEIGHYVLRSGEGWHVVDEARNARGVELIAYRQDGQIVWEWREDDDLPSNDNCPVQQFDAIKPTTHFRVEIQESGRHRFGGAVAHQGVVPPGSDVPLHHLLTIDLADLRSPFQYSSGSIRYLPMYYPLAYGSGGAQVQYAVVSDDEIEIVHMSDHEPDGEDAYFQHEQLPKGRAQIVPLTYEELRLSVFMSHSPDVDLDPEDFALWMGMGGNYSIRLGAPPHVNQADATCHNSDCELFERSFIPEPLVSVPPIPINGVTDFWDEYDNEYIEFRFGLCPSCRQIIAFNVCD